MLVCYIFLENSELDYFSYPKNQNDENNFNLSEISLKESINEKTKEKLENLDQA